MSLLAKIKPWILPVAFPLALFCILAWIYVAPFGFREVTWGAGGSSALIGKPLPDERVDETCIDDRDTCVTVVDEPLYMSIAPPAGLWHEMRVMVAYDLHDQEKFELGLVRDFTPQSFVLFPLEPWENYDGWTAGAATFPLENVQKENGAYKLIFSLPGVEDVQEKPVIHSVKVLFTRKTSVVGELKWFVKGLWASRP